MKYFVFYLPFIIFVTLVICRYVKTQVFILCVFLKSAKETIKSNRFSFHAKIVIGNYLKTFGVDPMHFHRMMNID